MRGWRGTTAVATALAKVFVIFRDRRLDDVLVVAIPVFLDVDTGGEFNAVQITDAVDAARRANRPLLLQVGNRAGRGFVAVDVGGQ